MFCVECGDEFESDEICSRCRKCEDDCECEEGDEDDDGDDRS